MDMCECRAAGCRCKHFKPEIALGAPRPHGGVGATQIEAGGITDPLGVDAWTEGGQATCTSTF